MLHIHVFQLNVRFLGASTKLRNASISFVMSVRQAAVWNSTPTGRILMKCDILDFFENLLRKVKFHENPTKITRTLHEDFSHL